MTLEEAAQLTDDELYAVVGKNVLPAGRHAMPPRVRDLIRYGKAWIDEHRAALAERICGDARVQGYFRDSRAYDRVTLAAAVLDLTVSLTSHVGGVAVAVLLVREGLEILCKNSDGPKPGP